MEFWSLDVVLLQKSRMIVVIIASMLTKLQLILRMPGGAERRVLGRGLGAPLAGAGSPAGGRGGHLRLGRGVVR